MKQLILLFLLNALSFQVNYAQIFKWQRSYGAYNNEIIQEICTEKDGNSVCLFTHFNDINNVSDTIYFDSFKYILPYKHSGYCRSFLLRLDNNGKVKQAKLLSDINAFSMTKDDFGNYYIAAIFSDSNLTTIGPAKMRRANGGILLMKLDKKLNFKWVIQTGNDTSKPTKINYSNKHLYFIGNTIGYTKLGNKVYNFANINLKNCTTYFYGELDTSSGNISWTNYLYDNPGDLFSITDIANLKGKLYLSGSNNRNVNTLILFKDTFYVGGFIAETDTFGNYLKRMTIHSVDASPGIICITSDSAYLYISGVFTDSFKLGNKIIKTGFTGINAAASIFFVASFSTNFTLRWIFYPKVISQGKISGGSGIFKIINADNFLYYSGMFNNKISFDSSILTPLSGSTTFRPDLIVLKSDLLGNVLWVNQGGTYGATSYALDAIAGKAVYLGGTYSGILTLGNLKDTSHGTIPYTDGFITKISDNAIIRGPVKYGPYCAGDSLKIPYIKIGDYDTNNIFIAQLSNEFGNFDSAYHELGRLKSNKDGTVTGKLPDIHISSSGQYRIRIMSTAPKVQSYYKADTLRLLIFSRDKANPGKDVTICRGDTVTIKTYGGTKWTWSPKYRMMDSTKAATLVWPDKTTKYKIIIADSSGCGVADTAYKTVIVRKDPKITITTPKDTVVCVGGTLPLVANFNFGDSLHYDWQWYAIDKTGGYTEVKTGTAKNSDTLLYTLPATEKDSQRFVLFLNDGCSPKNDFAYYTMKVSKVKPDAVFESKDTAVCAGSATAFIAHFTKGYAPGYNWKWMEKDANGFWQNIVSRSGKSADTLLYTLPLNWKKNKKKVVGIALNDGCSPFADTTILNISLRDTLQIALNTADTLMCLGTSYTWRAAGTGGYAKGYTFRWTNASNGQLLSTADSLRITADSTLKVTVSLTDNCMPKAISTSFTLNVNSPIKAVITAQDTTLCYGQMLQVVAKGSGGKGSGYTFNWKLNNVVLGNSDTLHLNTSTYFTKAGGVQKLVLSLGDNCTLPIDSIKIKLTVLSAIKTTLLFPDTVCYKSKVVFKAKGNGGKGNYIYHWTDANNVLQGNADSLHIDYNNANQSGTIKRIVTVMDGCSQPDTNLLTSEFLKPLSLSLTASDTCPTLSAVLNAAGNGGKTQNYTYDWYKENLFLGSTVIGLKTVTPAASTLFKAILKDGCSDASDTATIRIGLRPALSLDVKGFCLGETTIGKVGNGQLAVGKKYSWQLNNSSLTETDSFIKFVLPAIGKYQLKVSSDNSAQCIGRDTVDFSIIEQPKADFSYQRLSDFSNGIPFQFTDLSANANAWLWQFGKSGTSTVQHTRYDFTDTGTIRIKLIVYNQNSCSDSVVKIIPVFDRIQFFFPNAFSPNANGLNDGFGLNPNQYYLVKTYHLEIFNRWGEKVFKSDNVEEHWEASNSRASTPLSERKVQAGVYLFKAVITDIFGEKREVTGAVEVMR